MDREALVREAAEDHLIQEAARRRFLYHDVEELVHAGFLAHSIMFRGIRITLRSQTPTDLHLVQVKSDGTHQSYLAWTLAHATWVINGLEIEPSSEVLFNLYRSFWIQIPTPWLESFVSVVLGLKFRGDRALRLVEAFCYESYSRGVWKLLGKLPGNLRNAHPVVRIWVSFNQKEDERLREDQEWGRTVTMVSAMSNKGAKQIRSSLEKVESREKLRRQKVIEDAVNWVIQGEGEDQEEIKVMFNGKEVSVPRARGSQTTEDLISEMEKVESGEEDLHDMVVQSYRKRAVEAMEARREEARQKRQDAQDRIDAAQADGRPDLVGYTPEQLKKLRPDVSEKRTSSVTMSSQDHRLYDRYVAPKIVAGYLTRDMKVVSKETVTEGEAKETLQDKISNRKPKLKG